MIDSHCHLADKQFDKDLQIVIDRAHKQGITEMITIADSLDEADKCLLIAEKYDHIFCTAGVHPHNAKDWKKGDSDRLKSLIGSSKKMKAIGEIGLDYHYPSAPLGTGSQEKTFFTSPQDIQRAVFLEQLTLARELSLPAVVHCREAVHDIKTIVEEVEPLQLVIHCCTEKWEDIKWVTDLGHFLSFTGIATYPASHDIRKTIKNCPLKQIMIETDAPYLAPQPHRGKRNEPAFVAEVLKCIADIKGMSIDEADRITTQNTVEFFGLMA